MFESEFDTGTTDYAGQLAEPLDPDTARKIRRILMRLADDQENSAIAEAADVPYWKSWPDSVRASRAAARALRAVAETL
ncbi:MAG: hypothetical protein NVSMB48_12550 [Marmoricola sp.]